MNQQRGLSVTVKSWETIDRALKRFKKKINDDGRLEALKKKEYYETGTARRKREKGQAISRYRKKLEKESIQQIKLY